MRLYKPRKTVSYTSVGGKETISTSMSMPVETCGFYYAVSTECDGDRIIMEKIDLGTKSNANGRKISKVHRQGVGIISVPQCCSGLYSRDVIGSYEKIIFTKVIE